MDSEDTDRMWLRNLVFIMIKFNSEVTISLDRILALRVANKLGSVTSVMGRQLTNYS